MSSLKVLLEKIRADKKLMAITIGVAAALIIIIVVGLIKFTSPQRDLSRAFNNLTKAKSFHNVTQMELSLPVRLQTQQRPIVGVTTKVEGDVTYQEDQLALTGRMHMEARGRGMVLFAEGDLRLLPDTVAFNLSDLPVLLNPTGSLLEKWTYVNVPTLKTDNLSDVRLAINNVLTGMQYLGKEKVDNNGPRLLHFRRTLTPDQENILTNVFRQGASGNRGLQVIARLLNSFDVSALEVWVDPSAKTISQIKITFRRPSDQPNEFRSILTLQFSDYGKPVRIDRPAGQLTVQPEVFAKIFGGGDIQPIQQ